MDRLRQRIALARRASAQLAQLAEQPTLSDIERDAALQRFEYTCEAVWKLAQLFLREYEGIVAGSPKRIVRASLQAGLLSEGAATAALAMVDDRNDTVHTYNESLALEIASRLPQHSKLLGKWLENIEAGLR